jgi:hypothetical protein
MKEHAPRAQHPRLFDFSVDKKKDELTMEVTTPSEKPEKPAGKAGKK